MQVEISVEADEHVKRLVRCSHVSREDGNWQRVSHEVIGFVSESKQHEWSKLVGLVSSHVQDLGIRCVIWTVCGQGKIKTRVDTDVNEVVSVSSDADVVLCLPTPHSPAPVDFLLTFDACVFRVFRSGLFLNSKKASGTQVADTFRERKGETCCSSKDLFW